MIIMALRMMILRTMTITMAVTMTIKMKMILKRHLTKIITNMRDLNETDVTAVLAGRSISGGGRGRI